MFVTTSSDFDIFGTTDDIHGIVSRHVETVCCLYHQKKDFISVSYAPKNADYLEQHKNQLIK